MGGVRDGCRARVVAVVVSVLCCLFFVVLPASGVRRQHRHQGVKKPVYLPAQGAGIEPSLRQHDFPYDYHGVKPLLTASMSVSPRPLKTGVDFERPSDTDSAEEVIKRTQREMLHLRHTREELKKAEQEEKWKSRPRPKPRPKPKPKRSPRPKPPPRKPPRKETPLEEKWKKVVEQEMKRPAPKPKPKPKVHWDNPPTSWSAGVTLCGCVNVLRNSVVVRTNCDLRAEIADGEGIRIGSHETTVVEPRDARTLTLSDPYPGKSDACIKAQKIDLAPINSLGCSPLPGYVSTLYNSTIVRTSKDLRGYIQTGETIRIHNEEFTVVLPRDEVTLTLSRPYPFRTYGQERACKKVRPWDGGVTPVGCCIETTKGSKTLLATRDFRNDFKIGDMIRVRSEVFRVAHPFTATHIEVTVPSRLVSASGLWAFKMLVCTKLPGTVHMTTGSNVVTTSHDLRSILSLGDTVELGSEQFEVTAVPDPSEFFINLNWEGASSSDPFGVTSGSRCNVPNAKANMQELSCSVEVQPGSVTGRTTCDLTMEVTTGDRLRLCGISRQAVAPLDPGTITLDRPWDRSAGRCKVFRFASLSRNQELMDALQARRMRCQSLYCLAKVEEEERAVAFAMDPTIAMPVGATSSASTVIQAFAKAKQLEATAEVSKTAEDIAAAEAALKAAEKLEAATNLTLTANRAPTSRTPKSRASGKQVSGQSTEGTALNPSSRVAIATRVDTFDPSGLAKDVAHALPGVLADRAIMDSKEMPFPSVQANGKFTNDPEAEKEKADAEQDGSGSDSDAGSGSGSGSGSDAGSGSNAGSGSGNDAGSGSDVGSGSDAGSGAEEDNPIEGGGAVMAKLLKDGKDAKPIAGAKDGVGSTFKWWLEEGMDHKQNNVMQGMLNLKPSGKNTHGGAIDDNDHAVKILKEGGVGAGKDDLKKQEEGKKEAGKTIKPGHAAQLKQKKEDQEVRDKKGARDAIKKMIEDRIKKG